MKPLLARTAFYAGVLLAGAAGVLFLWVATAGEPWEATGWHQLTLLCLAAAAAVGCGICRATASSPPSP